MRQVCIFIKDPDYNYWRSILVCAALVTKLDHPEIVVRHNAKIRNILLALTLGNKHLLVN